MTTLHDVSGEARRKTSTPKTVIKPLTPEAYEYLTKVRGLSKGAIESYRLGCAVNFGMTEIALPVYDEKEQLQLMKFRHPKGEKVRRKSINKNTGEEEEYFLKTTSEPGGKSILFGSHLCVASEGPLVICFGDYDAISVSQCGIPNCVSLPFGDSDRGFLDHQYEFLESFKTIILFNDKDNHPNTDAAARAFKKFDELATRLGKERVKVIRNEDRHDTKDANELLLKKGEEGVRTAIVNAIDYPLGVVDVATYEEPPITAGVSIGIPAIDSATNGFSGGDLIILSGDNGSGKTTEALNIAASFIDHRLPVFLWSGEQKVGKIRYWFERIASGPGNLKRVTLSTGFECFFPADDIAPNIKKWYGGLLWQYIDKNIDAEKFFETAKVAVKRYGVKLIIVDNLMAFTTGEEDNYYRSQSNFAANAKRFAEVMDVPVVLICHNKKPPQSRDRLYLPDKDDVEGNKHITNWADIIIQMVRVPKTFQHQYENADTISRLCKARDSGMIKNILLKFEMESSRFWQMSEGRDYCPTHYKWETGLFTEYPF